MMGNVQHITRFLKGIDKNLSPCKWGMARPSLRPVEEYEEMVISFFLSPIGFLWFAYNAVAMYLTLSLVCEAPVDSLRQVR